MVRLSYTPDSQIQTEARLLAAESELIYRCAQALIARLTDNSNGYPTHASGSIGGSGGGEFDDEEESKFSPSSDDRDHTFGHASTLKSTSTERAALSTDEARRTKERYARTLQEARRRLVEPLNITRLWLNGVDFRPTEEAASTNDFWCDNHILFGMKEPRWQRNDFCRFCYDVKRSRGEYPNQRLCDIRSSKGKITVADLDRCMPRAVPAKGKKRKKAA